MIGQSPHSYLGVIELSLHMLSLSANIMTVSHQLTSNNSITWEQSFLHYAPISFISLFLYFHSIGHLRTCYVHTKYYYPKLLCQQQSSIIQLNITNLIWSFLYVILTSGRAWTIEQCTNIATHNSL